MPVSRYRQRRPAGGRAVQRTARHEGGQGVLPLGQDGDGHHPQPGHTTDGHDSHPRAIRTELGKAVRHRTSRCLNNRIEEQPDRAGPPGPQGPIPVHARVQVPTLGRPVLPLSRRAAPLSPTQIPPQPGRPRPTKADRACSPGPPPCWPSWNTPDRTAIDEQSSRDRASANADITGAEARRRGAEQEAALSQSRR